MTRISLSAWVAIWALGVLLVAPNAPVCAQEKLLMQEELGDEFGNEGLNTDPVTLSSWFRLKENSREGVLSVKAVIADNWHLYSITQPKGGPIPAKITVPESERYQITGAFESDVDPHVIEKDEVFGVRVEHHDDQVTWSAPIKLAKNVDPRKLNLEIRFKGQTCVSNEDGSTGACIPLSKTISVSFDGFEAGAAVDAKFQPTSGHAFLRGKLTRALGDGPINPGDLVRLEITAEPQGEYHIYAHSGKPGTGSSQPTLFKMTKVNGWKVTGPTTESSPISKVVAGETLEYHHEPVTWKFSVKIPEDAESKTYSLAGMMAFQTCTDKGCDRPTAVKFSADVPVGKGVESSPLLFVSEGSYGDVVKAIKETTKDQSAADILNEEKRNAAETKKQEFIKLKDSPEEIAEMALLYDADQKVKYLTLSELENNPVGATGELKRDAATTIWTALFGAFVGGMLLNLMPCVFPVLGLKVMGFVTQAGEDASKIRLHGLAFTAGLVVSMWVLAAIILTLKLSFGQTVNWGQQMGNPYFVCAIIVLLFLLGLNMAGVFEIGTSMTRVGGNVQGTKGYAGSFFSGVLTTLIATPCSGPFLGAAMGYTLAQPAGIAMFLFTVFALGIASPYLMLSFFPSLINKLPRPGAWMETFKVTMAFALFATVAFFMRTFGGQTGVSGLSWLAMALVVLGLAAYFYGNWSPPHIKPLKRRWFGFALPALIAGLGLWMCYDAAGLQSLERVGGHNAGGLAWQQWNPGKIEYTIAKKKKVVWVDYTADW